MLPWTRPAPHASFAASASQRLAELTNDVSKNLGMPVTGFFTKREIWRGAWYERGAGKGVHKRTLVGTDDHFSKCVWCERLREADRELDVDHYRPKVEVTQWTGEQPFVSDDPPKEHHVGTGYWWLAFEWNNYSLACKPCNQDWKRCLFPVESPRGPCVAGIEAREVPLLLDPGSLFRPRDHFRWTIEGIVEPLTPAARATIITMGLNRTEVSIPRGKVAIAINQTLDRFVEALRSGDDAARDKEYAEIRVRGSIREEFTSMVRWFVEERLRRPWEALPDPPPR